MLAQNQEMVNSRLVPLTSLRLILFAKVHQCVECPPKDLLREDDRPLASVQPHHPFCGGGYLYFPKSNSTSLTNILTVYVPTVLLNTMGHITVYFKPFFFEAIITVNLTVMLVLTTM